MTCDAFFCVDVVCVCMAMVGVCMAMVGVWCVHSFVCACFKCFEPLFSTGEGDSTKASGSRTCGECVALPLFHFTSNV